MIGISIGLKFHPCHFTEWRKIEAKEEDKPKDGAWLWWVDENFKIEKARLKIDAEDHFYPTPNIISEWNVIGWIEVEVNDVNIK